MISGHFLLNLVQIILRWRSSSMKGPGPLQRRDFVCLLMFVCNCLFIAERSIFQLSDVCHHEGWHSCKFIHMLSTLRLLHVTVRVLYVPHLLWNKTSVFTVLSERPDRHPRSTNWIRTRHVMIIISLRLHFAVEILQQFEYPKLIRAIWFKIFLRLV
jgi:hypothetical protein